MRNAGTETPTEFSLRPCNEYEEGVSSLGKYVRRGLLVLIKSALSTARYAGHITKTINRRLQRLDVRARVTRRPAVPRFKPSPSHR